MSDSFQRSSENKRLGCERFDRPDRVPPRSYHNRIPTSETFGWNRADDLRLHPDNDAYAPLSVFCPWAKNREKGEGRRAEGRKFFAEGKK